MNVSNMSITSFYPLIGILVVVIAIYLIIQFIAFKIAKVKKYGGAKYYSHKPNLITTAERIFIQKLSKQLPDNIMVCPQVRMADVLVVSDKVNKKNFKKFFYKISSKSIDFVFCDKDTFEIRCCLELDDPTHNRKDRVERDEMVNQAFFDAGMPLIRVPFSGDVKNMNYNSIAKEISQYF